MHTAIETQDATMLVYLEGELDHHNAGGVRDKIDEFAAAFHPAHAVLDFGGVSFMDSSGIGLVMGRYKLLQAFGCTLELRNLSPHVYKVMRLAGIEKIAVLKKEKEGREKNASAKRNETAN